MKWSTSSALRSGERWMSSSRRRETREVGVGVSAERPSRMLPFALTKLSRMLGVSAGPSVLSLVGRTRRWSYASSPWWKRAGSDLGVS